MENPRVIIYELYKYVDYPEASMNLMCSEHKASLVQNSRILDSKEIASTILRLKILIFYRNFNSILFA